MHAVAKCLCGELRAEVSEAPKFSVVCHCRSCKRRTGSAFGHAAYFNASAVIVSGNPSHFSMKSDAGRTIRTSFCRRCGTTLCWDAEFAKGLLAVAVGCFEEDCLPEPRHSVWNKSKASWVTLPVTWKHHEEQP